MRLAVPSWWRRDWGLLATIYVLAIVMRLTLWLSPLYGDEAWHFFVARHPAQDYPSMHIMDSPEGTTFAHYFWWRPAFEAGMAPAAWISFDAWRLAHILLTSLLPVFGYLVLRDVGCHLLTSVFTAMALAVHPVFVTWGVIVFPDGLLTTASVLALWTWIRDRPIQAFAWAVAATWVKEVGVVVLGLLGLLEVARGLRRKEITLWPLRLNNALTVFVIAVPLALLPLWYYVHEGGRPPGWGRGGDSEAVWDNLLLTPWMGILLVLGLCFRRSRPVSVTALGVVAFWLVLHHIVGRQIQGWYHVLGNALGVVASAAALDQGVAWARRFRPPAIRVLPAVALCVVGLVVLWDVAAPSTDPVKGDVLKPFTGQGGWSLEETIRNQKDRPRDEDILLVADQLSPEDLQTVLLIDFPWYNIFYPIAERAIVIRYVYTGWFEATGDRLEVWANEIERDANATIVFTNFPRGSFNPILLDVYHDCVEYENPSFVIIRGQACPGRYDELRDEYARIKGNGTA